MTQQTARPVWLMTNDPRATRIRTIVFVLATLVTSGGATLTAQLMGY